MDMVRRPTRLVAVPITICVYGLLFGYAAVGQSLESVTALT